MKILVTGANGYLGQGIVKQLLDDGHTVVATDLISEHIDNRAIIKEQDIFTIGDPYHYFEEPDAVLHLAWRNGFVHNALSHMEDLPNHYMFLKRMIDSGVKQVTVLGSMHEVGFIEGSIKESTPTNPMSLYGIGKDALRKSIQLLTNEKNIVFQWIRGFYIVGNSQFGCSIFSKISSSVQEGKTTFPFTSGQNQWDFLNYDEFCYQVAAIVQQNEVQGIINACSGKPEKLCERVERFIKDNNYNIELKYGEFPDRQYDSKAVWGDDSKIQEILRNRSVRG